MSLFQPSVLGSLLLLCALSAYSQTPVITEGSIVNGASFRPAAAPNSAVAAGSIVSIFGQNLAAQTAFATSLPLPPELTGTRVTIAGRAAPLFFVSTRQVNAQVPWGTAAGNAPVIVTTAAGASAAVNVQVAAAGPGLFSLGANGRGPGAIQNFVAAGQTPINSFSAGIAPGGILQIYATGLGAVNSPPADGTAGNAQTTVTTAAVTIGDRTAQVEFSGLAPGFVGLYQINARVPAELPDGCFLPVRATIGGVTSNTVTVAVHNSGGSCESATSGTIAPGPGRSTGTALLTRFSFVNALPLPLIPTPPDVFTAAFLRASASTAGSVNTPLPPANAGCIADIATFDPTQIPDVAALLQFTIRGDVLGAGSLTLRGPFSGSPITVTAGAAGTYQATLGLGAAPAGAYALSGAGGPQVGGFSDVTLNLPSPLFAPTEFGAVSGSIRRSSDLTATWSCPEPEGTVTFGLVSLNANSAVAGTLFCSARCSDGRIRVPASALQLVPPGSIFLGGAGLLLQPDPRRAPRITASGLDSGFFGYLQVVALIGVTVQ